MKLNSNVFKATVLILSITFICFACNKHETIDNSIKNAENPKEETGKLHNEQLKYVLENFNYLPENLSVKQYVEIILNQHESNSFRSATSLGSIPDFPENIDDLDLNEWLNKFDISIELKREISKTFDLFQSSQNLTEILDGIEKYEIAAPSKFEDSELDLYYEHLAVAKHSSIFWYPESEGGMNGIQYLNTSNPRAIRAISWWKVLSVDCVGGLMGGPGGYAGASAISVIMQL